MVTDMKTPHLRAGDTVHLDGTSIPWQVRSTTTTPSGRSYTILTCTVLGVFCYTVIDHQRGVRGPVTGPSNGLSLGVLPDTAAGINRLAVLLADPASGYHVPSHVKVHITRTVPAKAAA